MNSPIPQPLTFAGREFSSADLELIRQVTSDFAGLGITEIARTARGESSAQICGSAGEFAPLRLEVVRGGQADHSGNHALFKELLDRHHYLGYRVPFGASLRSMAELILSFGRRPLPKLKYVGYLRSLLSDNISPSKKSALSAWQGRLDDEIGAVELNVVRFAGGEPAGAHGILELFKEKSEMGRLFNQKGLVFIPSWDRIR